MKPQCILTLPLLVGTDGREKMSKSLGNAISIEEPAEQIFGKVMSIPDELMMNWFELVSTLDESGLAAVAKELEDPAVNPSKVKRRLARNLCDQYHGDEAGQGAEAAFDRVFVQKDRPEDVPEKRFAPTADGYWLVALIVDAGLAPSRKEARRLVQQGGVSVDDEKVQDESFTLAAESGASYLLRVGKRKFLNVVID